MTPSRKSRNDSAFSISRNLLILVALLGAGGATLAQDGGSPPAQSALAGGAAPSADGSGQPGDNKKNNSGTTNECQQVNFLPGVAATTIGSIPALQTKLLAIYTDPVELNQSFATKQAAGSTSSSPDAISLSGWTGVLGTNTIASNKDAGKMQLLFRNSGAYNLYISKVGYRVSNKTKSGKPPPKAMQAVSSAHDNAISQGKSPTTASDAAKLWVDVATQKAADLSKSQANLADAKSAKQVDDQKVAQLTNTVSDLSDQSKAATAAATAAITASIDAKATAATVDAAASAVLQGEPPSIDCSDPVTAERINATDRNYWKGIIGGEKRGEDGWRFFISNGLGVRALTGSGSNASTTGYGTFYLGAGLDKGGYSLLSQKSDGFFSGELYLSATTINKRDLNKMFSMTNSPGWFGTAGFEGRMALTQTFDVKIDYAKGLGGFGHRSLGDMTAISLAVKTDQVLKPSSQ